MSTDSTPIYVTFVVVRLYQPVCPNVPAIVRLYQLSDQRQSSEDLSRFLSYFRDKIVLKHILNNISIYMSFETLHCTTCRVPRESWTRECPNVPTLTLFLSLKMYFVLANSADPDEMGTYTAFHLGLHCLPKYLFKEIQ